MSLGDVNLLQDLLALRVLHSVQKLLEFLDLVCLLLALKLEGFDILGCFGTFIFLSFNNHVLELRKASWWQVSSFPEAVHKVWPETHLVDIDFVNEAVIAPLVLYVVQGHACNLLMQWIVPSISSSAMMSQEHMLDPVLWIVNFQIDDKLAGPGRSVDQKDLMTLLG